MKQTDITDETTLAELLEGRRLVIVAHPDDETLWAGGLMLAYPGDWTVVCCSIPQRDPIRAWKFFDACDRLGAKGRLVPALEPDANEPMVSHRILADWVNQFDVVVSHNAQGEYGHLHHRNLNRWCAGHVRGPIHLTFGGLGGRFPIKDVYVEAKHAVLRCYDHVTPYEGADMPKWQALEHRYGLPVPESFNVMPYWHWHAISDFVRDNGWSRGAELGVRMGQNLFHVLRQCPDLHMIGVDLFEPQPDNVGPGKETYTEWPWDQYMEVINRGMEVYGDRCQLIKARTDDAASQVADGSLDFVFIDADHSYDGVKADIANWASKVRPGGWILGHDIQMPGVCHAVEEAFSDYYTENGAWNFVWWTPVENWLGRRAA